MRIRVSRTGGFAGQHEDLGEVATEALPPDEVARIEGVIENLAAGRSATDEVGADFFQYTIDVITDQGQRSYQVADPGDPEGPKDPILAELLRLVGSDPPAGGS